MERSITAEVKNMFIGEYQHTLDAKGRIIVPSKFRDDLGDSSVITKGLDGCLFVYTEDEWKIFEEKVRGLPLASPEARRFSRFFLSGAVPCGLDSQSRITIPPKLREHAKLTKDVVLIGVSSRVEIWDKQTWDEYCGEEDLIDNDIAAKMAELGV